MSHSSQPWAFSGSFSALSRRACLALVLSCWLVFVSVGLCECVGVLGLCVCIVRVHAFVWLSVPLPPSINEMIRNSPACSRKKKTKLQLR
jgi:hypothetical protein